MPRSTQCYQIPRPAICPLGWASHGALLDLVPIYRLWNQRADSNHRLTPWPEIRAELIAQGWVSEGYGPMGVAFCAPTWE